MPQDNPAAPGIARKSTDAAGQSDLSSEIVIAMKKQPGDVVKCTRISPDTYRCNWWAPEATGNYDNPAMKGLLVTTHRVRQSRFLQVVKGAGGLTITDLSISQREDNAA